MKNLEYNRNKAVEYAKKWAYSRNPQYYNFDNIGGDCTNFVSQCIYHGANVMNYTKDFGWYYINANNKSPSWSGVEYLYNFLINNKQQGPYGKNVSIKEIELGDVAQLSFDGNKFAHTLLITYIGETKESLDKIKIASHTFDIYNKKISDYLFRNIRFIHIEGVRKY